MIQPEHARQVLRQVYTDNYIQVTGKLKLGQNLSVRNFRLNWPRNWPISQTVSNMFCGLALLPLHLHTLDFVKSVFDLNLEFSAGILGI